VVTIVNVALGFGAILLMLGTLRWRRHVSGAEAEIRGSQPEGEPPRGPADVRSP
jgi:hypothetical protein